MTVLKSVSFCAIITTSDRGIRPIENHILVDALLKYLINYIWWKLQVLENPM